MCNIIYVRSSLEETDRSTPSWRNLAEGTLAVQDRCSKISFITIQKAVEAKVLTTTKGKEDKQEALSNISG